MEHIALSTNKYLLLVEDGMYYGFKNGKHMQKYFEELESGKEDKKIEVIKYDDIITIKDSQEYNAFTVIHSQGGENKTTEFVLHENEPDEKALWLVQGLVQHLELTTLSTEVESPKTSYIAGGIISALLVCYSIWGYSIAMSMVGRRVHSIIYALLQPAVYLGPTGTAILGVILTALCIWFFIIRRSRKQYVSTTYGKGSKETV